MILDLPLDRLNIDLEDLEWERRVFHPFLTAATVTTMGIGFAAQAVPQAPQSVSWAFVALSLIGALTLGERLAHSYLMARLNADRQAAETAAVKAENAALKAELNTIRVARRAPEPGAN